MPRVKSGMYYGKKPPRLAPQDMDREEGLFPGVQLDPPELAPHSPLHTCDLCQKTLTTASGLKMHMNIHSRETVFQCDECPRTFLRRQYLAPHKRMHISEARQAILEANLPYKCTKDGCSSGFSTLEYLEAHEEKHTFLCAFCGRTTTSQRFLNYHIAKHTGMFPEQCKECKKWYTSPATFKSHKCCLKTPG